MRSWSKLPIGRVVRLDADAETVALSIDPLPPDAPAILTYLPGLPGLPGLSPLSGLPGLPGLPGDVRSVTGLVASVLRELDEAAIALFPAWLPGADGITGPGGAQLPAVRSLALRRAAASEHYGPFLAELAQRALTGGPSRFGPEVRAAGLTRALADSFGRADTAILVHIPEGLPAAAQEVLVAGCEWLAHRAGAGVWLTGAPLNAVDRVETIRPDLANAHLTTPGTGTPRDTTRGDDTRGDDRPGTGTLGDSGPENGALGGGRPGANLLGDGRPGADLLGGGRPGADSLGDDRPGADLLGDDVPGRMFYPAIAGRPHPGSPAEQALEAALAACGWASGRAWNQTYRPRPLAVPIRLDLLWEMERCVVEIDGADHRGAAKFAADRERDVRLQLDGYAVLRFLDVQVLTDTDTVIRQIAQFLRGRRGTEG